MCVNLYEQETFDWTEVVVDRLDIFAFKFCNICVFHKIACIFRCDVASKFMLSFSRKNFIYAKIVNLQKLLKQHKFPGVQ